VVKTVVVAGTAGGDAQVEASATDAAAICHETKIPQHPEV
jgi:hypothetical protein